MKKNNEVKNFLKQHPTLSLIIGITLILTGIVLGFYVGGYLFLIKGVIQIITAVQTSLLLGPAALDATALAFGIGKIVIASFVGVVTFLICAFFGTRFISL